MSTTANNARPAAWSLSAVLDYAVASHRRAAAVLVAFALIAFLPGFFQIPPVDRDEARFAQATKQMLETGEYVDIRFQQETRYKKPIGIYWLQAAVVKTAEAVGVPRARTTIWLYRVPSLLGATGAVLPTRLGRRCLVTRLASAHCAASARPRCSERAHPSQSSCCGRSHRSFSRGSSTWERRWAFGRTGWCAAIVPRLGCTVRIWACLLGSSRRGECWARSCSSLDSVASAP